MPTPATWGPPAASWLSDTCDIPAYFRNMNLVFVSIAFLGRLPSKLTCSLDQDITYALTCVRCAHADADSVLTQNVWGLGWYAWCVDSVPKSAVRYCLPDVQPRRAGPNQLQ